MQKELKIRTRPEGNLYDIHFDNGGELPKELGGVYTSRVYAQRAINTYLIKRDSKRGPAKKTTGD